MDNIIPRQERKNRGSARTILSVIALPMSLIWQRTPYLLVLYQYRYIGDNSGRGQLHSSHSNNNNDKN